MRFTLGITTRYIDRHPTASMTNKMHLWRINPKTPQVLSYEQQITALSKVCNINKPYALEHMNVVFPLVAIADLQP
jgi:hypothetical protein